MLEREPWIAARELDDRLFEIEKVNAPDDDFAAAFAEVKQMIFLLRIDIARRDANSQQEAKEL